jgi:hypothetical protein
LHQDLGQHDPPVPREVTKSLFYIWGKAKENCYGNFKPPNTAFGAASRCQNILITLCSSPHTFYSVFDRCHCSKVAAG